MTILDVVIDLKHRYMKNHNGACWPVPIHRNSYFDMGETFVDIWSRELGMYESLLSALKVRQRGTLVIFKYLPYEVLFSREDFNFSNFWDSYGGVYRDCRGIVIDLDREEVVMMPFRKFFNIGENNESLESVVEKEMESSDIIEFSNKLDGTLIIARYLEYRNETLCTTSGMFQSSLVDQASKILDQTNYQMLLREYKDSTLLFEFISPNDPHVVSYSDDMFGLHLIGINKGNSNLLPYSEVIQIANEFGVSCTDKYEMTFRQVVNSLKEYKASEKEGYVMYLGSINPDTKDAVFNRLYKIKCDDYKLMIKILNKISPNDVISAIYHERVDDVRSGLPKGAEGLFNEVLGLVGKYVRLIDKNVSIGLSEAPENKKEFFVWIKSSNIHPAVKRVMIQKYLAKFAGREYHNPCYLSVYDDGKQVSLYKYAEIEKIVEEISGA